MDLTARLLRAAAKRPRVLLVPAVAGTAARLAVEAETARRGWPAALGPADADVLVVAGRPGPELEQVLARVWRQVPLPRARVEVVDPVAVPRRLDAAVARLADPDYASREEAADDSGRQGHGSHGAYGGDQPPAGDEGPARQDSHAHHAGHGAQPGHGSMPLPGGLPMADLGEDRDGLMLDQLHVPLGPVLPDWPPGLVLWTTLQGDVVQDVNIEVLDGGTRCSFWDTEDHGAPGVRRAARELDAVARLLAVAGWADAACRCRRIRDQLLAGVPPDRVVDPLAGLSRRITRSRTLRWLLADLHSELDVRAVLRQRLTDAQTALTAPDRTAIGAGRITTADLPPLLRGVELAAVRLLIAAADPDDHSGAVRSDEHAHG